MQVLIQENENAAHGFPWTTFRSFRKEEGDWSTVHPIGHLGSRQGGCAPQQDHSGARCSGKEPAVLIHLHHSVPADLEEAGGVDRLGAASGLLDHLEGAAPLLPRLEGNLSLESLHPSQIIRGIVRPIGGDTVIAVVVLLLKELVFIHGPWVDQNAPVPGRPGQSCGLGLLGTAIKGAQRVQLLRHGLQIGGNIGAALGAGGQIAHRRLRHLPPDSTQLLPTIGEEDHPVLHAAGIHSPDQCRNEGRVLTFDLHQKDGIAVPDGKCR